MSEKLLASEGSNYAICQNRNRHALLVLASQRDGLSEPSCSGIRACCGDSEIPLSTSETVYYSMRQFWPRQPSTGFFRPAHSQSSAT